MVSGIALRDFYIDAWRRIVPLVNILKDQDPGMIRASTAASRIAHSLEREVLAMPEGSIFVAYQGFGKGNVARNEITKHEIAAFIRAASPNDDANIPFGPLMIDSIPDGDDQTVRYLEADPNVDAMDMPKFERVGASQLTIDVWKLSFMIPEHAP